MKLCKIPLVRWENSPQILLACMLCYPFFQFWEFVYAGFRSFRGRQLEAIEAALSGKEIRVAAQPLV
jgi:hypothetical protein